MIHGNSSCRGVFRHQLDGYFGDRHLVTFDLPGHGASSNAPDPKRTYTRPGLAEATLEMLHRLGLTEVVVLGWSLGGHIALEMLPHFPGIRGLMIVGAPPISGGNFALGFKGAPQTGAASKAALSEEERAGFLQAIFGRSAEPFLHDAMARADGRFRERLFEAGRAGMGSDAQQLVQTNRTPLAVVNGAADNLVKVDYFDTIEYANLWEGRCHRLDGSGHAPFFESPGDFNPILERFLADVAP
jgi:pimeloyl-ACP methyl ester carboxylesterase